MQRGKWFLHEHPFNAKSWKLDFIMKVRKMEGVYLFTGDQCCYGQGVFTRRRGQKFWCKALKRTGWLTNIRS